MKKINKETILDAVERFERDRATSPELAETLRRFAEETEVTDPLAGSAVWALGKRFDAELKPFFIAMLKRTYRANPEAGYQCMIALDNLDENILPEGGCVTETNRNIGLAEAYLTRIKAQPSGGG